MVAVTSLTVQRGEDLAQRVSGPEEAGGEEGWDAPPQGSQQCWNHSLDLFSVALCCRHCQ